MPQQQSRTMSNEVLIASSCWSFAGHQGSTTRQVYPPAAAGLAEPLLQVRITPQHSTTQHMRRAPVNFHSVIDRPDRVRRVKPPSTTILNTQALQPPSHHANCRRAESDRPCERARLGLLLAACRDENGQTSRQAGSWCRQHRATACSGG